MARKRKAAPPDPTPPTVRGKQKLGRYERLRRMDVMEDMLSRLLPMSQIESFTRAQWGIGRLGTRKLIAAVKDRWLTESADNRAYSKQGQIRRLHRWLKAASSATKSTTTEGPDGRPRTVVEEDPGRWKWPAIAQLEHLLAELEGTKAPVEVKHEHAVTGALSSIIGSMSEERRQQLLEEQREMRRLAEAAGFGVPKPLPQKRTITVKAG